MAQTATWLGSILLVVPALLAGTASDAYGEPQQSTLVDYSPARPPNPMWSLNQRVGAAIEDCGVADVTTIPSALPDSVIAIRAREDVSAHLPIMTTVDFSPARRGTGPDWHAYPAPNRDMRFVAALYDVGIGVQVFDAAIAKPRDLIGKSIAVPRRPSSLRVMAEAILGDAWDVLDDVTLVDLPPDKVRAAIAEGGVAATTWNMMIEMPDGFRPMLGDLPGHWLDLSERDINAIYAASDIGLAPTVIKAPDPVRIASFKQGLAAWSSTPDDVVMAILVCLSKERPREELADWPGLEPGDLHPAAADFFAATDELREGIDDA